METLICPTTQDLQHAKYFSVFVLNEYGAIMMIQKKNRLDLPNGKIEEQDEDIEDAVRRVVFKETKTDLGAIAPVAFIQIKNRQQQAIPTAIFVARTDGEAQIKPDAKTHHRFMEEVTFLMQSGYRNKKMHSLLEDARRALVCEEIKENREEETQTGKEKYNYRSCI